MTIQTASIAQGNAPLAVSFKLLLALYAVIPICLIFQLTDSYLLQGDLLQYLPSSPSHFLLFQLLFGTPHILASAVLLTTNKDYFSFYQKKIIIMTLALMLFFTLASQLLSYYVLYIMVASWTVYHVLKQQHGVGRGIYQLPGWAFYLLLWLSIGAGISVYMGIFLKDTLTLQQAEWVKQAAGALVVCLLLSTFWCQRYVKTRFGSLFMWANSFLIIASFYFYLQQYYFLAILIPRLVHDATAYIFYVTHDFNKHAGHPQNFLYRWAAKIRLNVFIVLPLVSFVLTFLLQKYGDQWVDALTQFFIGMEFRQVVSVGLIGYFSLMHYYTEAFTWKYGSPYRKYIRFKP
ncbi:hypothetical protein BMR07_04305 [Methylococcaceae bacterium CS1]|nr:hypothetical protein BMR10_07505 [Methylococcaceae bacterium CS4]TXK98937.1 hypothetical protein BMR11_07425 [Methylococcaceae bacterium CS5]TXL06836.1 hypothetical protein BMR09_06960 [Methylococcaceae bacterium CS3]TXL07572.1 hypothetical protein BMR07_04305 [Methylococcaceae bacterium CS1]TXL11412.1 hypothetical protein BMR08_04345 [Methylococcaceae bacterium CS2]